MKTAAKKSHTGFRNGKMFCFNCGRSQAMAYPMSVGMFSAMAKQFDKEHKPCEPVWKQPVVDQSLSVIQKCYWWYDQGNGEQGSSSNTMFSVLSGRRIIPLNEQTHPSDPDDFRRCYLLLQTIPEWGKYLDQMCAVSKVWENLVNNWEKLTAMLEEQLQTKKDNGLYDFMKSLGC